jgi:mannitol/fructose-specific phosphotransferase system IIA component (Ntr-type)
MRPSLNKIFDSRSIILDLKAATKEAAFIELADAIITAHPECDRTSMLAALWEREEKLSTGIASGVALPHAFYNDIEDMAGAIGISKTGIEYGALDQKPVHVIFMLITGIEATEDHLRVINKLFFLAQSKDIETIMRTENIQTIKDILSY